MSNNMESRLFTLLSSEVADLVDNATYESEEDSEQLNLTASTLSGNTVRFEVFRDSDGVVSGRTTPDGEWAKFKSRKALNDFLLLHLK